MRRRSPLLDEFEARLRAEPPDIELNRRLVAALFEQARAHGIFPLKNPLDGIEVDIRLARALHVRRGLSAPAADPAPRSPSSPSAPTAPPS